MCIRDSIGIAFEDTAGNFWFSGSTSHKLLFFDKKSKKYSDIGKRFSEIADLDIRVGGIDSRNRLWFSGSGNTYYINLSSFYTGTPTLRKFADAKCQFSLFGTPEGLQILGKDQKYWYEYNNDHDTLIKRENGRSYFNISTAKKIFGIFNDRNGDTWITTDGDGLYVRKKGSRDFLHLMSDVKDPQSVNDNIITALFTDKSGIIWIGTINGVCTYNSTANSVSQFKKEPDSDRSLTSNFVRSVFAKDEAIWIGEKGITVIDRKKGVYQHLRFHEGLSEHILSSDIVNDLYVDDQDNIYVAGVGINRINVKLGKYEYSIPGNTNKNISSWVCWKIHKGQKSGKIWIATFGGLNLLDTIYSSPFTGVHELNAKYKHFRHDSNDPSSLASDQVWEVFEDTKGRLWAGTDNGLSCFIPKKNKFSNYKSLSGNNESLAKIVVTTVYEDTKGRIWVGTEGLGLLYMDEKSNQLHLADINNVAHINVIWGITGDEQKNLWITSASGLIRYQPENGNYRIFGRKDGFLDNAYKYKAIYRSKDGIIYIGGSNGLCAFHPSDLSENRFPPDIVITGLSIYNKPVELNEKIEGFTILNKNILTEEKIEIPYHLKVFTIDFASLHYYSPFRNHCKYILEGFDKKWTTTDADKRSVTYTNLSPGKYTFKVMASNCDGIWNAREASLEIIILPPFWMTWWFKTLSVIAVLLTIILIFRLRLRTIKKQKEVLERQVSERTIEVRAQSEVLKEVNALLVEQKSDLSVLNATKDKFFSIIAHDLKNPFSVIMGFSDIMISEFDKSSKEEKLKFLDAIKQSSSRAFGLLENLLQWARSQTRSITVSPVQFDLHSLVAETFSLLCVNADKKRIRLVNNVDPAVKVFADRNMIDTVIRNLINNAIKFSMQDSVITVRSQYEANSVIISVADQGVGMQQSVVEKLFRIDQHITNTGTSGESGTGLGLIICQEFIQKNNGRIWVNSEPGIGSEFFISLPAAQEKEVPGNIETTGTAQTTTSTQKTETITASPGETGKIDLSEIPENRKILIVEDNPDIRITIRKGLPEQYEVAEASTGKEGWDLAVRMLPDLIISDVVMPEMDGFQLCQKLKTDESTSHIPVLLLTAQTSDSSRLKGLDTGADDYITKPFNHTLLNARIKNLIKTRQQLRERFSREVYIEAKDIAITSTDERFIEKAIKVVEDNIGNTEFSVHDFSENMAMSRTLLHNKLKSLTDQSATEFIKTIRLKRAAKILTSGNRNIAEVSLMVGFNNRTYFTKCFVEQFGCAPSEYSAKDTTQHS